jgi:phage shock protein A
MARRRSPNEAFRHRVTRPPLAHLRTQVEELMATVQELQTKLAEFDAKVAANTAAVDAVVALIKSFPVVEPTDPAALQGAVDKIASLEASVDASTQKLQAAVTENPPA